MIQRRLSLLTTTVCLCILGPGSGLGQVADRSLGVPEARSTEAVRGSIASITDDTGVLASGGSQGDPARVSPQPLATGKQLGRETGVLEEGRVLRLGLDNSPSAARLRPGSVLEGSLQRAVYAKDREVIPAGSRLQMRIGSAPHQSTSWRASVYRFFRHLRDPEEWKREPDISVQDASLTLPDGRSLPLDLSFIRFTEAVQVGAVGARTGPEEKKTAGEAIPEGLNQASAGAHRRNRDRTLLVRLNQRTVIPELPSAHSFAPSPSAAGEAASLSAGTQIRLMLLTPLQASHNHEGDTIQARLMEPVRQDGRVVLSEGDLFEGRIGKLVPPRRLNRAASLHLNFYRLTPGGGAGVPISANLVHAETDGRGRPALDSEGTIHAGPQGRKAQIANLGVSFLTGKIIDDIFETGLKLSVAGMTSGSAATAARYVGLGAGVLMFLSNRGKDVTIPQFSELDLTLARPVVVPSAESPQNAQ